MASSLLRRISSVVPIRPTVARAISAYHHPSSIHSTRQHSVNTSQRRPFSSPSLPKFEFDLLFLSSQIKTGVPSMLFTMANGNELTLTMPGLKKVETEEGLWVSFAVQPTVVKKEWNMTFEGFNLLFQLGTPEMRYLATIKVPENFDRHADLKVMIGDGVCSICLPTLKIPDPIFVNAKINREIIRPTQYCVAFDRANLRQRLCKMIAQQEVKSKSFTAYKNDDGETIYMKGNMPGLERLMVTSEGLCVWLTMPGLEIEDVELGFEYDALIIEGKKEGEHYIAGIRVPEGFQREVHMIGREMEDGVYKATLPRVDDNKHVFSLYR